MARAQETILYSPSLNPDGPTFAEDPGLYEAIQGAVAFLPYTAPTPAFVQYQQSMVASANGVDSVDEIHPWGVQVILATSSSAATLCPRWLL